MLRSNASPKEQQDAVARFMQSPEDHVQLEVANAALRAAEADKAKAQAAEKPVVKMASATGSKDAKAAEQLVQPMQGAVASATGSKPAESLAAVDDEQADSSSQDDDGILTIVGNEGISRLAQLAPMGPSLAAAAFSNFLQQTSSILDAVEAQHRRFASAALDQQRAGADADAAGAQGDEQQPALPRRLGPHVMAMLLAARAHEEAMRHMAMRHMIEASSSDEGGPVIMSRGPPRGMMLFGPGMGTRMVTFQLTPIEETYEDEAPSFFDQVLLFLLVAACIVTFCAFVLSLVRLHALLTAYKEEEEVAAAYKPIESEEEEDEQQQYQPKPYRWVLSKSELTNPLLVGQDADVAKGAAAVVGQQEGEAVQQFKNEAFRAAPEGARSTQQ